MSCFDTGNFEFEYQNMMDKSWTRFKRNTKEYQEGVRQFVKLAVDLTGEETLRCPCIKCQNLRRVSTDMVAEHLVIYGLDVTYTTWIHHGESFDENEFNVNTTETFEICKASYEPNEDLKNTTNEQKEAEFHESLKKAGLPLYADCSEYSQLDATVVLYKIKKKSKKFQELRATQDIPHTCSRKGYARLEDEMKKESPNPESITRIDVWSKGHTKKDGTASNRTVSETLEKIREYRESVASSKDIGDDALSKVLGPKRCGRVRGLGSGVTPSKVGVVSENKAHVTQLREEVGTLKEQVAMQNELIRKLLAVVTVQVQQGGSIADLSSIPDVSALLHPTQNIDVSKVQRAETPEHISEPQRTSNPSHSTSPPQVQRVETTEHILELRKTSKHSHSSSPPQGRGNANMLGRKCKLINWSVPGEVVAIGRWDTDEPDAMVHSTHLGENASRVWIDHVINARAPLWRITSFMETMEEAKGTTVAWPNTSIIFDDEK